MGVVGVDLGFCVYQHIRLDTESVFYVGKGRRRRPNDKYQRSDYWKNIVNKHGYRIEIVEDCLSEPEAYALESKLIKGYRVGGGCEANFTDGGDGFPLGNTPWNKGLKGVQVAHNKGLKTPQWVCDKISETKKAQKTSSWNKGISPSQESTAKRLKSREGYVVSDETKKKMSVAHKGRNKSAEAIKKNQLSRGCTIFKAIRLSDDTEVWRGLSQAQCARDIFGKVSSGINSCLKGTQRVAKGHRFEYV